MRTSILIARLIGPVLSIIGIGVLANGDVYRQMAEQLVHGYPFIYFSGVFLLLAGLAILNVHNDWTPDWRSLITALGWLGTGVGTFRTHRAAVSRFRRRVDHCAWRVLYRRRHRAARAWRLHHFQRLRGGNAALKSETRS